ncbi:hypothetical protein [Brevundimonas sp. SL130]|uniref:hypothetical protein n=1 Tax=Brevundimonas sp. SL130 TaxID=2995143 RepID=UPI00226D0016|nr:hypothetical protein [Brevundimonas sp. SL130]WAC59545.1 hypothetical protein OU998_15210 [Brevundimonas sp. SL130]
MAISINYPSDFVPAEPAPFDVADPTLFLGVDPLILLLLFVIGLLLFAAGGWGAREYSYRREGGVGRDGDAVPQIYKRLLHVLENAMKASSNALPARAQEVEEEFQRLLGPLLVICASVGGPLKDLKKALIGDAPKEEPKKADKPAEPKPEAACGCGGHGGQDRGCSCGVGAARDRGCGGGHSVMPAVIVSQTVVANGFVCLCGRPSKGEACTCPKEPAKPHAKPAEAHAETKPDKPEKPKKMPEDQRARALREALQALYDHWSVEVDRIRELENARRALCTAPPKPKSETETGHSPVWSRG